VFAVEYFAGAKREQEDFRFRMTGEGEGPKQDGVVLRLSVDGGELSH